jgi:hypothetical protein
MIVLGVSVSLHDVTISYSTLDVRTGQDVSTDHRLADQPISPLLAELLLIVTVDARRSNHGCRLTTSERWVTELALLRGRPMKWGLRSERGSRC